MRGFPASSVSCATTIHAMDSCVQVPGASQPAVAAVMAGLAGVLSRGGNLDEAEVLLRKAVATLQSALGANHNKTLAATGQLAQVLRRAGKMEEAQELAAGLKAQQQQVSGRLEALTSAEEEAANKAKQS